MAAVNHNIGKIRSVIEDARKLHSDNIDYFLKDPKIQEMISNGLYNNISFEDPLEGLFIWGIHKWGDNQAKVGE